MQGKDQLDVLMGLITEARKNPEGNVIGLGQLLVRQPLEKLQGVRRQIENIAVKGETPELKRLGYAAWVAAAGPGDAFLAASKNKDNLRDFLDAVPTVDEEVRGQLFAKIEPLIFELPSGMQAEGGGSELREQGIRVDYFYPSACRRRGGNTEQNEAVGHWRRPQDRDERPPIEAARSVCLAIHGQRVGAEVRQVHLLRGFR